VPIFVRGVMRGILQKMPEKPKKIADNYYLLGELKAKPKRSSVRPAC
jgi:hypothetical protein